MGASTSSYLSLNVVICGVNGRNISIINRLFPDEVSRNKRKLQSKDDGIFCAAILFQGDMNSSNNLNQIREYINRNFDQIQNGRNEFQKMLFFIFQMRIEIFNKILKYG